MRQIALAAAFLALGCAAHSQQVPFADRPDSGSLATTMRRVAGAVIAKYRRSNRTGYLEAIFPAQLISGDDKGAVRTLSELHAKRLAEPSLRAHARDLDYLIYAKAKAEVRKGEVLDAAYAREFRTVVSRLDDRTAAILVNTLTFPSANLDRRALRDDLSHAGGKALLNMDDAVRLLRDYNAVTIDAAITGSVAKLADEDDRHRYVIEKNINVPTVDGASVCALVVRPRGQTKRPAILEFTIYNDPGSLMAEARRNASNGYAGVEGLTRGKGCSPGPVVPYVHDGADADKLIEWTAQQPWSDGRVGMYGGSYNGFTTWAAAKNRPAALKAIMVGAPNGPGIDTPMENGIFWNFIYPWPFYTTDNKTLDNATYDNGARWRKLDHDWYASGRAYRDLDKIDGTPNPIFDAWLDHPTYDAYWQRLIPYRTGFAHIGIPALITAGYYYGGPGAATYYFGQYQHYSPRADVYLLIGPYDHFMAQRGTAGSKGNTTTLAGYRLDPVALTDLVELRYRWFDHELKGAPMPALLVDHVNYEVTGASVWKHAPSLSGMARGTLTFHISSKRDGQMYRLTHGTDGHRIALTVNFADRSDADRQAPGGGVEDDAIDMGNGVVFASDPFPHPTELSGLFSGTLDFVVNKRDFDFEVDLYELTKAGRYIQLAPYWSRASMVGDTTRRRLLVPGKPHSLSFRTSHLMSRLLARGSRLVAVLRVIKEPDREINYGTGGTVADESIADAKVPLKIEWLPTSSISVPLGR